MFYHEIYPEIFGKSDIRGYDRADDCVVCITPEKRQKEKLRLPALEPDRK